MSEAAPAAATSAASESRPLRLWPAIVLLILMWAVRIVPGYIDDLPLAALMAKFMGPAVCGLLVLLWWAFFSRAPGRERMITLVGIVIIGVVTSLLVHFSMQGFWLIAHPIPWGITAFTVAIVLTSRLPSQQRMMVALLAALVAFGYWDLVRNEGSWGDFHNTYYWRWEATPEDKFLAARQASATKDEAAERVPLAEAEWPAFRGDRRDGVAAGVKLGEDWQSNAPRELWRILVGPGWSSFAVAGDRLFTQEQRGEDEVVVCYDANDGSELWAFAYPSRFWESIGGAGPRATPTLDGGQLFAMGAEGYVHCLDAVTGEMVWSSDVRKDAGREPPQWGFSSSPLVIDDVVVVHAGGKDDKGVLAYDRANGTLKWSAPAGDHSYSSPQRATVSGKTCVAMLDNEGLSFFDPSDGKKLGAHDWQYQGYRVVQPLSVGDSRFLMGTGMSEGTMLVEMRPEGGEFASEEVWKSRYMKPDYNDFVAHEGYLYGFDRNIFACIDLETGKRQWKKGRYGNGQVLLLPDADQLLVISETGELVLLRATPEKLEELARHQVLEGKTWNHPVVVGNRLYARNGEQAICFEMPLQRASSQ